LYICILIFVLFLQNVISYFINQGVLPLMIKLMEEKVLLREATQEDINELYYWKYEEKNQEAKKWNGID